MAICSIGMLTHTGVVAVFHTCPSCFVYTGALLVPFVSLSAPGLLVAGQPSGSSQKTCHNVVPAHRLQSTDGGPMTLLQPVELPSSTWQLAVHVGTMLVVETAFPVLLSPCSLLSKKGTWVVNASTTRFLPFASDFLPCPVTQPPGRAAYAQ